MKTNGTHSEALYVRDSTVEKQGFLCGLKILYFGRYRNLPVMQDLPVSTLCDCGRREPEHPKPQTRHSAACTFPRLCRYLVVLGHMDVSSGEL